MPNVTTYSDNFYERVFKFAFNKLDRIWIVPFSSPQNDESIHTMSSLRHTASIGIPIDFYVAGARNRPYLVNTIWIGRPNDRFLRTQLRVSLLSSMVEKIGRRWSGEACQVPLIGQDGKDLRIEIGKSIIDRMQLFNGACLSLAFDEIELMACGSIEELSVMMDLACIS